MAENIISNSVKNHGEAIEVANWISQINAGGTVYDIATHHGITFKDGKGDTTGTTWNGLTDLEIVIPNITDIVQTPIEFAGTVGADGKIYWIEPHGKDGKAEVGNLVFITADCTFESHACEAGDMAIYDGSKWNIVTGENQVELVGTVEDNKVTVKVGAAADVLKVEGKTLSLVLDYTELDGHVKTTGGKPENVTATTTVGAKYLKLTQGNSTTETIGEVTTLKKASQLTDGTVTFTGADNLVNDVNFGTFTPGTLPTFEHNSVKELAVTGGELTAGEGNDYVKSVSLKNISFVEADASDANKIAMITGITAVADADDAKTFVDGIHVTKTGETADFTIAGYVAPTKSNVSFVEGLDTDATKVVTDITAGGITLNGTSAATATFATTFGAATDGKGGDVLSDVTVTANKNVNAFTSAEVNDHVLSFNTTAVADSVSVTYQSKSLATATLGYTAPVATKAGFITSGFENVADTNYTFGRGKETTYTTDSAMWKLKAEGLTVEKGAYTIDHTNMVATVEKDTFLTNATQGTLPSLTGQSVTNATLGGSVNTALSYVDVNVNTLISNEIAVAGAYSLGYGTADSNDVVVGADGDLDITASVDLTGYLTDVQITESKQA